MGRPKALLEYQGETLLDRQIALHAAFCRPVVAVLGFSSTQIVAGLRRADEAVIVLNPRPERGQLSSLQCGLRALPPCSAVFFLPVDSPGVQRRTLQSMIEAWSQASPKPAFVIPRCGGRRGHPVLMDGALIPEILALPLAASARDAVHAHQARSIYLEVDDPRIWIDLDAPEDYEALLREVQP
jgi:molybdenum cofactor cytidylyltransferase